MTHRAKDLNGNMVYGHWIETEDGHFMATKDSYYDSLCRPHGISPEDAIVGIVEIDPTTLAQYTTVDDKHGKPIYGPVEYEAGRMSNGGDSIQHDSTVDGLQNVISKVVWLNGHFAAGGVLGAGDWDGSDVEIIAPTGDAEEAKTALCCCVECIESREQGNRKARRFGVKFNTYTSGQREDEYVFAKCLKGAKKKAEGKNSAQWGIDDVYEASDEGSK